MGILFVVFSLAIPYYAEQRSPMRDPELIHRLCEDKQTPIVCFPRNCDSVAFYMHRNDLSSLKGKQGNDLLQKVLTVPRTVVLFTHDHSLRTFEPMMPGDIYLKESISLRVPAKQQTLLDKLIGVTPWGLCDIAVVQHKRGWGLDTVSRGVDRVEVDLRQAKDHEDDKDRYDGPHSEAGEGR
jgi:hypothetical protein